jgi:hypothetical protein
MKSKENKYIKIVGKYNEVSKCLKEYEKKYTYVYELIDDLKAKRANNSYLN